MMQKETNNDGDVFAVCQYCEGPLNKELAINILSERTTQFVCESCGRTTNVLMLPSGYGLINVTPQRLDFTGTNFTAVNRGKRTTIRLARKDISLGDVSLRCGTVWPYELSATVVEITEKRFCDMTAREVYNDGFTTRAALLNELSKCYGEDIAKDSIIKIITFKLPGDDHGDKE